MSGNAITRKKKKRLKISNPTPNRRPWMQDRQKKVQKSAAKDRKMKDQDESHKMSSG